MIFQKPVVLLTNIGKQALNALYTSCRWVAGAKNMFSMFKKSQDSAWKEGGDSHPDYILASLETPGEPETPLEKAMKAPIDLDKLRNKGL
jgi:hypothetical protein